MNESMCARSAGAIGRNARSLMILLAGLAGPAFVLGGCGGSALTIESSRAVVSPTIATAVYATNDPNIADIYLSDLPPEALVERLATGVVGEPMTVIHIHMFIEPRAGKTPVDFGASNVVIRQFVFTGQSLGVYGGGGFYLTKDGPGASVLSGRIRDASLRLISSKDGFADRLGPATLAGKVSARRDEDKARAIASGLLALSAP